MGQDFKIQNTCDHRIIKERATLDPNRVDISVKYPIASNTTVVMYLDNNEISREDYGVITQQDRTTLVPIRRIKMKRRVRSAFPRIEVSYFTVIERCPKCLGVGVLDDYEISSEGDIRLISNEAYLIQQVEKFVVTRLGSNKFHPWMGTTLQDLAGTKINDMDLIRSRVLDQVRSAVDKLRDVQSQMISAGRFLTPGEQYGSTRGIEVLETEDPTTIEVLLSFTAKSGKTIEYSQFLELERFRKRVNI